MKPAALVLALLLGPLSAQAADPTPRPRRPEAQAPQVPEPPAAAGQPARQPEVDLSTLVPKDSARQDTETRNSFDRHNSRGVNCSLYPSRC